MQWTFKQINIKCTFNERVYYNAFDLRHGGIEIINTMRYSFQTPASVLFDNLIMPILFSNMYILLLPYLIAFFLILAATINPFIKNIMYHNMMNLWQTLIPPSLTWQFFFIIILNRFDLNFPLAGCNEIYILKNVYLHNDKMIFFTLIVFQN